MKVFSSTTSWSFFLWLTVSLLQSRYVKCISNLNHILFPNRTFIESADRSLADTVPCVICRSLSYCSALNNLMVQEVYYPNNLDLLGTCYVLEALGKRVSSEIFGPGRSFRDTTECREIVMQYLCLFYGSNNDMYTNLCINQEDVSDPNPANHKVAPRYPCRSFCVQVATVCAQDPDFILLCEDITCPPTQDDCTPDPTVSGVTLAANLECSLPYDTNPYVRKSDGATVNPTHAYIFILILVVWFFCYAM